MGTIKMMVKKVLAVALILSSLAACASWFGSSQQDENNPAVGGRQDSSDMLFGQAESSVPVEHGINGKVSSAPVINASAPVVNASAPAINASAAK